jgi:hypothetical protein
LGRGDRIPGARHPDHAEVGLAEAALDARAALQFHVEMIEPLILPNIAERSLLAEVLRTTAKIVSSLAYDETCPASRVQARQLPNCASTPVELDQAS